MEKQLEQPSQPNIHVQVTTQLYTHSHIFMLARSLAHFHFLSLSLSLSLSYYCYSQLQTYKPSSGIYPSPPLTSLNSKIQLTNYHYSTCAVFLMPWISLSRRAPLLSSLAAWSGIWTSLLPNTYATPYSHTSPVSKWESMRASEIVREKGSSLLANLCRWVYSWLGVCVRTGRGACSIQSAGWVQASYTM